MTILKEQNLGAAFGETIFQAEIFVVSICGDFRTQKRVSFNSRRSFFVAALAFSSRSHN